MIHAPLILQPRLHRKGLASAELRGQSIAVAFVSMKEPENVESREAIAYRLELTRLALGMTKGAFAQSFGVTPQAYTNYFNKGNPDRISLDTAARLCRVHGVSLDWLFRGHLYAVRGDLREKIELIRAEYDSKGRQARETS